MGKSEQENQKSWASKNRNGIIIASLVLAIAAFIVAMLAIFVMPGGGSEKIVDNAYKSQIDTQRRDEAASLVTSLTQYQANNRNKLPQINGNVQITNGSGDTQLDKFYQNYFNRKDVNGAPYKLQFVSEPDATKIKAGINYLNVFYNATCDSNGNLVKAERATRAAVVFVNYDETGYYCVNN